MSKLYLESSPEFKNGIGLEFGAEMSIFGHFTEKRENEGFQRANVDVLYIKMMDFHRPSISRCEKRGFSLKNEIW